MSDGTGHLEGTPDPRQARAAPYLLLVGASVVMVGLRAGIGPIRDIDAYWHVVLGREILAGTPPSLAGRGWSFADVPDTWVSTQWLAEVVLAQLERWGGLDALIVYRSVTTLLALATLSLVTVRRRPAAAGAWLFLAGALALGIYSQERSQQLTFIIAPLVGWWIERTWRDGRLPRWWIALPLVVVWSNVHGGWILLPLGLVIAAAARAVDHGWRDRAARRAVLLAILVTAGSAVSPSGFANTVSSLRIGGATAMIEEWAPLSPWSWTALPLTLTLGIAVVSWGRGSVRPSRGELVLVLSWTVFGCTAWRNMTPAVLVLAPIVTGTLSRALGLRDPTPPDERPPLRLTSAAIAVVGGLLAISTAVLQTPVVAADVPLQLLERLRSSAPQRALVDYNISGPVLYVAGPDVTVSIDGRADRYGGDYIAHHLDLVAARPGWERSLAALAPTAALLRTGDALTEVLVAQRGWVEVGREGDWVLLRAPGSAGWPATSA